MRNWIEWNGGKCPVPKGVLIDLKLRGGNEWESNNAPGFGDWRHDGGDSDIIAYRLCHPEKKAEPEAVEWDGNGLPPVGCECEMKRVTDWMPVTINFISIYHTIFTTFGGTEDCYQTCSLQFRPIRTEAERQREAALKAMIAILQEGTSTEDDANNIYDAIAAGKIPGIMLKEEDA